MTDTKRPTRFARNAVANGIAFLFTVAVAFFLSPYVVEHLGATRYGVWSLIASLVGYLGLLDLGIRQAVNRYIAGYYATGAHRESSLIVSAALRLFGFLGILAILSSGVLAYLAPILFNIPEALANDARTAIVLGGLAIAVSLVGGVFGGVVSGLERFLPASNLAVFFLQTTLILPLVPVTAWFLCLSSAEKEQVKSVVRKRIERQVPGPML